MDYRDGPIKKIHKPTNSDENKSNTMSHLLHFEVLAEADANREYWFSRDIAAFSPTLQFQKLLELDEEFIPVIPDLFSNPISMERVDDEGYSFACCNTPVLGLSHYLQETKGLPNYVSQKLYTESDVKYAFNYDGESKNISKVVNKQIQSGVDSELTEPQTCECFIFENDIKDEIHLCPRRQSVSDLSSTCATMLEDHLTLADTKCILKGGLSAHEEQESAPQLRKRGPDTWYQKKASSPSRKRKQHPPEAIKELKLWIESHSKNPYPTKAEKLKLSELTGLSMQSIQNWLSDYRINRLRVCKPARAQRIKYMIMNTLTGSQLKFFLGLESTLNI